jgi:serine/threonine protein kinase
MFNPFRRLAPSVAPTKAIGPDIGPTPGSMIAGRFLVREVFEGGLGKVCVVKDVHHRSDRGESVFVLKFAKPTLPSDQQAAFRKEAAMWVLLGRHPAIVPAYWVDEIAGSLCVAAEYIAPDERGRTSLRQHLSDRDRPLAEIIRWSSQFLFGMQHAAGRGMVSHADIKPENLLIDRHGNLHITDFGLAKADTSSLTLGGTPPYMSPEQWRGEQLCIKSDLYSFGIVLHELCYGERPWVSRTLAEARAHHLHSPLRPKAHPLATLIEACTRKDVGRRYQLEEALNHLGEVARANGLRMPEALGGSEEDEKAQLRAQSSIEGAVDGLPGAFNAAREYTRRWPDDPTGWTQLGRLHLSTGNDLQSALDATLKSLSIDETRSPPWNNLGLIMAESKQPIKAIEAYRRALECEPDNTGAMLNMASSQIALRKFEDAIRTLQGALTLAPDKYAAWVNLGAAYQHQGERLKSLKALRRAHALAPYDKKQMILDQMRIVEHNGQ